MEPSPKTHAGPGDIRAGQAYFPMVGKGLYAVERVFCKGDDICVLYRVIGGALDGHGGEVELDEFHKRVRKP